MHLFAFASFARCRYAAFEGDSVRKVGICMICKPLGMQMFKFAMLAVSAAAALLPCANVAASDAVAPCQTSHASEMPTGAISGAVKRGDRVVYEEKGPSPDVVDLMVRDRAGVRKIVDMAGGRSDRSPCAIDRFSVSPDGRRIAVTLGCNGTETKSLSVYDAATGNRLAGPLSDAIGMAGWSGNSQTLYFTRRNVDGANLLAWNPGAGPVPILAYGPDVMDVAIRQNEFFLISRKMEQSKLLALRIGKTLRDAVVLIPAHMGVTLETVHPAEDAVYVLAGQGTEKRLLRIPVRKSGGLKIGYTQKNNVACRNCRSFPMRRRLHIEEIALPDRKTVLSAFSDPLAAGVAVTFDAAGGGSIVSVYDPVHGRFAGCF